ncbi:MAG TPA: ABC transporter permease [Pyrinomonadaceae bacterium]|nr:ABC transporter permease [Pyrinomonadaceae bacterium]
MRKFLAIVKREYFKVVWTKVFILTTLLAPIGMLAVSLMPMLMFSIKGNAVRLVVVEENGKIYQRLQENLSAEKQLEKFKKASEGSLKNLNPSQDEKMKQTAEQMGGNFVLEEFKPNGKTLEQIQNELIQRIADQNLDAYLIVPPDFEAKDAKFEFYARNASDFISKTVLEEALNDAVRLERLAKVNISEAKLKEINQKVNFSAKSVDKTGSVKEGNDWGFGIAFGLAFLLYITITLYGSVVMGAIVEEKETKIAEILFSSAKPFQLMMGKLVGVCLSGLTQVSIWVFSILAILTYALVMLDSLGAPKEIPNITPIFVIYFFLFFLAGFFLYSTIYALIGSMVTTTQEGGQFVIFTVIVLMAGLYSVFPIVRDPNSTFSIVVSLMPFVSPIAMPARIFIESPPFWQILLSLLLNVLAICGLVWAAARVYRVGMLMYGKKATIPEVWRWIWQS